MRLDRRHDSDPPMPRLPPAAVLRTTRRPSPAVRAARGGPPGFGVLLFEDAQLVAAEPFAGHRLRIGRAPECELRVSDPEVSRYHCELRDEGGRLQLRDLGSANGCFVGGRRVERAALAHGDVLTLGQTLVKVVGLDSFEWTVHRTLYRQIYGDELSGLLNRRGMRRAAEALLGALPDGAGAGLLLLDIDRFKQVNDGHGHAAGDAVIAAVAALLRAATPERGLAARLGGEEFALLLRADQPLELPRLGRELCRTVEACAVEHAGQRLRVTVSIGMAWQAAPLRQPGDLLQTADEALYRAKQQGRNRCELALVAGRSAC